MDTPGARSTSSALDSDPTTTITDAAAARFLRLLRFLRLDPVHCEANQAVQRTGASRHAEWRCGSPGWLAPVADLYVRRLAHLMSTEPDRQLQDTELELVGRIYGHCPVQAEGAVRGRSFYFRARHAEWEFSLAMNSDIDPVDICSPEQGFYRAGSYGKDYGYGPNAGWMPYDEVEQLIRGCIDEYLQTTVA